ncbi:MAG: polysaccharide lyase family 8 super-sandwich domain-containing protein [Marinifilaceae bacterium]
MKIGKLQLLLVIGLLLTSWKGTFAQSGWKEEMARIRKSNLGQNLKPRWENISTEKAINLLKEDGSFSDLSPDKKQMTGRILQMAIDYHKGERKGDTELRMNIYKAMQYWLDHRPKYRFPSIPFETLRACAAIELVLHEDMMKDRESSQELKKQVDQLRETITEFSHWCWYNGKSPEVFDKHRGHNRGGNVGYRLWAMTSIAACSEDTKKMDWVLQIVKEQFPRVVNTNSDLPTGFTPDGSWIQHNAGGAQNYWIGYGVHWINHVLNYAKATKNTRWALTNEEFNTIADYYLDGIQWYHYRNHAALNLAGRHNALKEAPMDKGAIHKYVSRLLDFKDIRFERRGQLEQLLKRNKDPRYAALDSTKYFWNTDLLIHSKPNSYFAIKMLSNRTTGCETSESSRAHGKNNFFSGDGSTMIYRTGTEYDKARIGWNWRAIPGITAEQKTGKLPLTPWGRNSKSLNQFAGGLSDGEMGIAAFQYQRAHPYVNLKARKAYFTFGKEMLALGNGIQKINPDEFEVWTTLNQTERKGAIHWKINGKKGRIKTGKQKNINFKEISKISWVHHDGTGYILLPQDKSAELKLFAEQRTGNWADLDGRYDNPKNKETNVEVADIFQLSINHGTDFDNADYAYLVVPGVKLEEMDQICKGTSAVILKNSSKMQAIQLPEDKVMAVFHKKGMLRVNENLSIESNSPVVLQLKRDAEDWLLRVADPLHQQEKTEITITWKGKTVTKQVVFPQHPQTGASIETSIKF